VALVGATGCGQVVICAVYLSNLTCSWHLGHSSVLTSVLTLLPFQFLPLNLIFLST